MTSNDANANPYLFVVGCPRSGTTLLQRMLDHHPSLAVANDTHFIPHVLADELEDRPLTPALVEQTASYRRFRRLGLTEDDVAEAARDAATYGVFVGRLYAIFARARGKPFGAEKTPDYVRHLPGLSILFPGARFLHIIRDGRDVALSVLEWATETKGPGKIELWREEPVAVCALWWRRMVEMGRGDGRGLGERYRELRYESLAMTPERTIRDAMPFLGLPFDEAVLAFNEGKLRDDPSLSAKSAWRPPTPGLRDWRESMTERDLQLFEALAGDLLVDLGYERGAPGVRGSVTACAERCRAWWSSRRWSRLSGSRSEAASAR